MSFKVSIVTPTLNQGQFITDTIESVLNQDYNNFEHIILDGGSTDDTLDILKKYKHLKWISEKDTGPANAINKGFRMASGDIFTWLNSDDYFEKNIFQMVVSAFKNNKLIIGNLEVVNINKRTTHIKDESFPYNINYLTKYSADIIKQPCTFFTKDLFFKVGGLDESLKLVFDYDLFLKMLSIEKPFFIHKTMAYQRDYEETLSSSFQRTQAKEIFKISKKYGAKFYDPINLLNLRKLIFPHRNSKVYDLLKKVTGFSNWKHVINKSKHV